MAPTLILSNARQKAPESGRLSLDVGAVMTMVTRSISAMLHRGAEDVQVRHMKQLSAL